MIGPLLFATASFFGATPQAPPPPPPVVTVAQVAPATAAEPAPAAPGAPGHYDCGGVAAADQYLVPCHLDPTVDPGPNNTNPNADPNLPSTGDLPGKTLGSTDAAYGADLTAQFCAVKPMVCDG